MKIAVCFIGMIRTGIEASENLKNWFKPIYDNIDFFIHTWEYSESKQWHEDSVFVKNHNIVQDMNKVSSFTLLEQFSKAYDSKIVSTIIESQEKFFSSNLFRNYRAFSPQWYSWYKVINLVELYEKENEFKYDVIVKIRPDIIFPKNKSLHEEVIECMNDQTSLFTLGYDPNRIDDVMFLSSSDTMKKSSKFFLECHKKTWETNILGEWLVLKNIQVKNTLSTWYTIYRKEHIDLGISPLKFNKCFNVDRDYYAPYNIDRLPEDDE